MGRAQVRSRQGKGTWGLKGRGAIGRSEVNRLVRC